MSSFDKGWGIDRAIWSYRPENMKGGIYLFYNLVTVHRHKNVDIFGIYKEMKDKINQISEGE